MGTKTFLKVLAGATALALSGHSFAQTNANAGGTIFLDITDVTTGASFIFDTGQTLSGFTGTVGYGHSLSGDANYTAFEASVGGSDILQYAVVGGATSSPFTNEIDSTASSAPGGTVKGNAVLAAWQQVNNFLGPVANPSGGSSYLTSAQVGLSWTGGGFENNFNSKAQLTDFNSIGTAMNFYQEGTNNPNSSVIGAVYTTYAGQWNLTSGGQLSYTVAAVPLPAPVLLLLSSLAMLGLIGRRRSSTVFGAAA
jgi:hypothetical protein